MAMDVFIHPWHHTDFNHRVTVVHHRGLCSGSKNLPGQPGAVTVQLLYTSPPAESWSKGSPEHVPCWSVLPAAAPAASMLHSGQKSGMAILYRQVFSAQNRHLRGVRRQRGALPSPWAPWARLRIYGLATTQRPVVTATRSTAFSGMIMSGKPRLLPLFPAQPGRPLAFLSQGHTCIGLGLKPENPSVTVTMDYYYIMHLQCGFG